MTDKKTDGGRWAELEESWRGDPGFRSRMEADPRAVLAEHGIEIPSGVDVRLAVDSEDTIHVVAPPDPNRAMSDAALGGVVGGTSYPRTYEEWSARVDSLIQRSRSGDCFLTTAVAGRRGEADDGPTLSALRGFRDGYMSETEERREMVAAYYETAPAIVAAIPADHADWDWIGERIDAAIAAIGDGDSDAAFDVYAGMVRRLTNRWLG